VANIVLATVPDSMSSYSGPTPIGDYSNLVAIGKVAAGNLCAGMREDSF